MLLERKRGMQDGKPVQLVSIECGECEKKAEARINSVQGHDTNNEMFDQLGQKKFTAMGWLVGKKPRQHRCPDCLEKATAPKEDMKVVTIVPKEAPPPRDMNREDRRLIFEKLNEIYIDEGTGYGPGWTDAKVATDLGVPKAWVAKVRDEMFGPEGFNEEIRLALIEGKAVAAEIKTANAAAAEITDRLRMLLIRADTIEKVVLRIEKEVMRGG